MKSLLLWGSSRSVIWQVHYGLNSPCSSRRWEAQRRGGCRLKMERKRINVVQIINITEYNQWSSTHSLCNNKKVREDTNVSFLFYALSFASQAVQTLTLLLKGAVFCCKWDSCNSSLRRSPAVKTCNKLLILSAFIMTHLHSDLHMSFSCMWFV